MTLRGFAVILGLWLGGPTLATAEPSELTVSAAVSLKDALTSIAADYQQDTGERVRLVFGSSGQLAGQIKSGAPVDVFISAAQKQVNDLAADKLIDESTRRVIAGNRMVLIVPAGVETKIDSLASLAGEGVKRIAVGEPGTVPAGQYAMQVLKSSGLESTLKDRLVFGTNVRQVLDYVERGEVDAGLVYATDARQAGEKVRVVTTAPVESHEPITYPAVVVAGSKQKESAGRFVLYLSDRKAQETLARFGFAAPPLETKPAGK